MEKTRFVSWYSDKSSPLSAWDRTILEQLILFDLFFQSYLRLLILYPRELTFFLIFTLLQNEYDTRFKKYNDSIESADYRGKNR